MTIIVKSRDSLLTSSSGYTNYRGILNLVIILLVLSNARAALENVIKYGILVDPVSWILFLAEGSKHWPALLIISGLSVHILIGLAIETVIAGYIKSNGKFNTSKLSLVLLATNLTLVANLIACISIPPIIIYVCTTHPISTSASLMIVSIVFLKLISYHMMNFWCRDARRPERLQSRTTKSFLRSYVPPRVDFGLEDPNNQASTTCQSREAEPKIVNGDSTNGLSSEPISPKKESILRKRISGGGSGSGSDRSSAKNGSISSVSRGKESPSSISGDGTNSPNLNPTPSPRLTPKDSRIREISLKTLAKYPDNINLTDMCQFMSYPTLCYELDYAKTERIRKRFLIKRIIELIVLSQLDLALVQQWIVPTVSNSIIPFRQMHFSHMFERLLKLAIPNHIIWLIWFYMFFHSLLNIAAELTRFADREFYRDWWNSESVNYFWSNWNIPVHKWCARHLYIPLMSLGLNRCQASTAVFFVSAFFHEYLVSVPLKIFRMWAFTGMLMQLPWARFVSSYFNNYFANVAVWLSLILGQPLCILMYYHDYYVINNIKALPAS